MAGEPASDSATGEPASVRDRIRELFALERDVLVLSVAMFAFSLGFQMTSRYLGEYMVALGASAVVVGLYGTFSNVISAVYPYPGGAISDRIGSRLLTSPTTNVRGSSSACIVGPTQPGSGRGTGSSRSPTVAVATE